MSKIGVMMSAERAEGQMSAHFGKAEWIHGRGHGESGISNL